MYFIIVTLLLLFIYFFLYFRHGQLPLIDAIENDNHEAIRILKKCGAHIPDNVHNIGENLCK